MKKSIWNGLIDAVSLLVFSLMISTGLLLKYILPSGSGRLEKVLSSHGRGHQSLDVFINLTRHQWGEIHFYISLVFLALLILHIILHWQWLVQLFWKSKSETGPRKKHILTITILTMLALSLSFPWLGLLAGQKQTLTKTALISNSE